MKTAEKIDKAKIPIAELELLIKFWEQPKPKKTNGNKQNPKKQNSNENRINSSPTFNA